MKTELSHIKQILRNQALERVMGAIQEVKVTYYGGESKDDPLYQALRKCEKLIKDNY